MKRLAFIDAGIIGILCNPNVSSDVEACNRWLETHLAAGIDVWLPEIADFEVRRKLIQLRKSRSLARLDGLKQTLNYAPITTEIKLHAALLWATARQQGYPTADAKALDADVILAATAMAYQSVNTDVIIATTNVRHLSRFVPAALWQQI